MISSHNYLETHTPTTQNGLKNNTYLMFIFFYRWIFLKINVDVIKDIERMNKFK